MLNNKSFKFSFWPFVITLTTFVILCKLGFWQLERAEQKQRLLTENLIEQPLTEDGLLDKLARREFADLNLRKAKFSVTLLNGQQWLLDNKVFEGKVGYELVIPAQVAQTEHVILVSLGWWPAERSRQQLPEIEVPSSLTVTGLIKSSDFETFLLGESQDQQGYPKRVQSLATVVEYRHPQMVSPVVLFAQSDTILGHPRLYNPVVMPPEKHRAYALQWFLLAFFSVVVFVGASWRTTNNSNKRAD